MNYFCDAFLFASVSFLGYLLNSGMLLALPYVRLCELFQ